MPDNPYADYPMSWKPDRSRLKRPVYMSLAEHLENDVRTGLLRPGMRLPAQRELADFLGINFTTVTRSYKLCEMKGLVYAVTGSGTFVSPHAARSVTISSDCQGHYIDLAFVASFEQCNAMLHETIRSVTRKKYFSQLLDYEHPSGMPHHKTAGIAWMKSLGLDTDREHVAVVSGALNALCVSFLAFFKAGDRIAVDVHTFPNFIELSKMYGLQLIPIPSDVEGMFPDELEARCRSRNIRGIFLMPSCCNPTTGMTSEDRKRSLAKIIRKYNLILLEDDMYAFLTAGIVSDYQGPVTRFVPEQSLYICSVSKALSSGLRVAYVVFGEQLEKQIIQAIYNSNVKTSSLNTEIVTELLKNGKAGEIMAKKKTLAEQANALYKKYFSNILPHQHPLSFFRWLPLGNSSNGEELECILRRSGVQVYHSFRFAAGADEEKQFLRVALSTTPSMGVLKRGLAALQTQLLKIGALSESESRNKREHC